jgi:hypothetical protein
MNKLQKHAAAQQNIARAATLKIATITAKGQNGTSKK